MYARQVIHKTGQATQHIVLTMITTGLDVDIVFPAPMKEDRPQKGPFFDPHEIYYFDEQRRTVATTLYCMPLPILFCACIRTHAPAHNNDHCQFNNSHFELKDLNSYLVLVQRKKQKQVAKIHVRRCFILKVNLNSSVRTFGPEFSSSIRTISKL